MRWKVCFRWNTWSFAIGKDLAANFDRVKLVERVLGNAKAIRCLMCPTLRKSLKGVQAMGDPPRSKGIGLSPLWK